MKVERKSPLFITHYDKFESAKITHSIADLNQRTILFYIDSDIVNTIKTEVDVYQRQFGIAVAYDNTKCFIQYWEKPGVVCYSLEDGKKLWEYKKLGHINCIIEHRDKIYCGQEEKGIIIIDTTTGEEVDKIKGFILEPVRINKDVFIIIQASQNFHGCYNMLTGKFWKPKKANEITELGKLLFFENVTEDTITFKVRKHEGTKSIEWYEEVRISDLIKDMPK